MAKMITKSAADIAKKWGRRSVAAVPDAIEGVKAVTESPMEKAIGKKDKMLANVTKAIQNGKWEEGLRKVSLSDWKEKTATKMGERMAGGINAAIGKRQKFDEHNINVINAILPEIEAMPDLTIDDSIARTARMMRHMADNPYKKAL